MANAPPEPPSPMTTDTTGARSVAIASSDLAMASLCPRSSAPTPGYAPGVSIKVMSGKPKRSANFITRCALR